MNPSTRFKALIDRKLREHWSPEQALAIYDLLSELGEIIWRYYEIEMSDLIAERLKQNAALQRHSPTFNEVPDF
uniref:Uncharacterized protein n=1 Tax=Candidatus Kentrum sp. TUN TaxID=2126343 RepID=A0A451AK00_9GAMM|nr:MAG: hypothetical protein BECKTUN1418D_GA0071000_14831 [Candidatus Kentron sp. TUN]